MVDDGGDIVAAPLGSLPGEAGEHEAAQQEPRSASTTVFKGFAVSITSLSAGAWVIRFVARITGNATPFDRGYLQRVCQLALRKHRAVVDRWARI